MSDRGRSGGGAGKGAPGNGAPEGGEVGGLPSTPPCPFCKKTDTELVSAFGSHASVSTYWCNDCRSPFELLKWQSGDGHKPRIMRG